MTEPAARTVITAQLSATISAATSTAHSDPTPAKGPPSGDDTATRGHAARSYIGTAGRRKYA